MKLGDSGAVLVEFAIILPVMLLLTLGMVDVGGMLLQSMQLNFVTEGAAYAEATAIAEASEKNPGFIPGSGISWAQSQSQLSPPATFFPGSGAGCVGSKMPLKAIILPLPELSTQACWPVPQS